MSYTGRLVTFFETTGTTPDQWAPGDFSYALSGDDVSLSAEVPGGAVNVAVLFEGLHSAADSRCQLCSARITEKFTIQARVTKKGIVADGTEVLWAYVGSDCIVNFVDKSFGRRISKAKRAIKDERRTHLLQQRGWEAVQVMLEVMAAVADHAARAEMLISEAASEIDRTARKLALQVSEAARAKKNRLPEPGFDGRSDAIRTIVGTQGSWTRAAMTREDALALYQPPLGPFYRSLVRGGGKLYAGLAALSLYRGLRDSDLSAFAARNLAERARLFYSDSVAWSERMFGGTGKETAAKNIALRLSRGLVAKDLARYEPMHGEESEERALFTPKGTSVAAGMAIFFSRCVPEVTSQGVESLTQTLALRSAHYALMQKTDTARVVALTEASWATFLSDVEAAGRGDAKSLAALVDLARDDYMFESLVADAMRDDDDRRLLSYMAGSLITHRALSELTAGPIFDALAGAGGARGGWELGLRTFEEEVVSGRREAPKKPSFSEYGGKTKQFYLKGADAKGLADALASMGFKKNSSTGGWYHTDKGFVELFTQRLTELAQTRKGA